MRRHAYSIGIASFLAVALAGCASDAGSNSSTAESAATTAAPKPTEPASETEMSTMTGMAAPSSDTMSATSATESAGASGSAVVAGEAFPAARCDANKAAGKITYLSGFDYAAASSIVEVIVAESKGYYDDLCLDVEFVSAKSWENPPQIAANKAQFSSGGSFSEVALAAQGLNADLVVLSTDGHVPIDSLMVKHDEAASLADLKGKTIGVQKVMTSSVRAMLADQGLVEGTDFTTVALPGFDAVSNFELPDVAAIGGWRSNEPGQLERAGVKFDLYAAGDEGVPGSFGLIYTNAEFLKAHPTAAEDFMRATMKGLSDAIADPKAAANTAVELINANGNPNFLSPEGETFRWETESKLVTSTTPKGMHPGMIDPAQLAAEIAAYDKVGVYAQTGAPSTEGRYNVDILKGVYGPDGQVIWPS